jgi:DNA-binding response OmpR family regulator
MVRDMLPPDTFEVIEAPDGIKGLEMVQTERPWMIMLDFLLPRMSGFEVYENIQQNHELCRIPLLLMSGRKEEVTSKIPEPFEDKYLVFIEKPFEQKELIASIKKAMILAQKRPTPVLTSLDATPTTIEVGTVDTALVERIVVLESKLEEMGEMEEKIKVLEQQVATQHKQIQQIVAFVKQKIKEGNFS